MSQFSDRIYLYAKKRPVTFTILLLNTFMLLVTIVRSGNIIFYDTDTLYYLGALYGKSVNAGEYFRLFTVMLLHGSIFHFLFNNYAIYVLGGRMERLVGSVKFAGIYILTGLASSIAIVIFDPKHLTVGASGALFGVMGIFFYMALFRKDMISFLERSSIYEMLILNLIITVGIPQISIAGHIGGLIFGFLLGFPLLRVSKKGTYYD